VVHFVGDLHQPLHSTDHHDRGGNDVPVVYRGHRSNLHHLWDVELVREAGGVDAAAFAQRLDQAMTPADIAALATGSPVDWVNETHAAAVSVAYGALPENADDDLAGAYAETACAGVDSQLLKAGLRLAALLNAALK
jgi:S1/P1 Nuclease